MKLAEKMWLDDTRGNLVDWSTQKWVEATGKRIDLKDHPWLEGPTGYTDSIGIDFFDRWAAERNLSVKHHQHSKGILPSFNNLQGPSFQTQDVHPDIIDFYENTTDFEMDVWSEWGTLFRPFSWLVSIIFSRRLQQLNLPISSLDTSWGFSSEIVEITGEDITLNAWVRTLVKTQRTIYIGTYSAVKLPYEANPCIKTVFPLPNGNAIVILRPEVGEDGSLKLVSKGKKFGDAGFYFTVHHPQKNYDNNTSNEKQQPVDVRYLRSFCEDVHVYPADKVLRTDHTMSLWGRKCFHLHYKLQRKT